MPVVSLVIHWFFPPESVSLENVEVEFTATRMPLWILILPRFRIGKRIGHLQ